MKNKVFISILWIFAFMMVVLAPAAAYAEENPVMVELYGSHQEVTVVAGADGMVLNYYSFIKNGQIFIPLEAIPEAFGATVSWNAHSKTATIAKANKTVKITVNTYMLDFDLKSISYVPLLAVAEPLGFTVNWNKDANTVNLSSLGAVTSQIGAQNLNVKMPSTNELTIAVPVNVVVDGKEISLDQSGDVVIDGKEIYYYPGAFMDSGYVYVPISTVYAFGAKIIGPTPLLNETAIIYGDSKIIYSYQNNNPKVVTSEGTRYLDENTVYAGSTMMVSVRLLSQVFGLNVKWDEKSKTIYLDTKNGTPVPIRSIESTLFAPKFSLNPNVMVLPGTPSEFIEIAKTVPCNSISPREISNGFTSYIAFVPQQGKFVIRRAHNRVGSAKREFLSSKLGDEQETILILKAFFPTSYNKVLAMMQKVESQPHMNTPSFLAIADYDGRKVNVHWELNATILEIQNKGFIQFQPVPTKEYDVIWTPETTISTVDSPIVNPIQVKYNGNLLSFDSPPVIQDDRLLVPIRPIAEAMGATLQWDQSIQTAELTLSNKEVHIIIDQKTAYVDGEPVTLDVPAQIIGERTMVPLRFISEGLGATVAWDDAASTASITYTPSTEPSMKVTVNNNKPIIKDQNDNLVPVAFKASASAGVESISYYVVKDGKENLKDTIDKLNGSLKPWNISKTTPGNYKIIVRLKDKNHKSAYR